VKANEPCCRKLKAAFIAETLISGNVETYFLHNYELAEFTATYF